MCDYVHRRLPLLNTSRKPPTITHPVQIDSLRIQLDSRFRRIWVLVLPYLPPHEVLLTGRLSKAYYTLSWDVEIWREILQSHYKDFTPILNRVATGEYLTVHFVTGNDFNAEHDAMRNTLSINPDEVTEYDELELKDYLQASVVEAQPVSLDELKSKISDFRAMCITMMQLSCIACHRIKPDLYRCKLLKRNICTKCRYLPKYTMLSQSSVLTKYCLKKHEFETLKLPYIKTVNPISIGFTPMQLYYDYMVGASLGNTIIPSFVRRGALIEGLISKGYEKATDLIYGKVVQKYLKGEEENIEKIMIGIIRRYERKNGERPVKRIRTEKKKTDALEPVRRSARLKSSRNN
jgi:hypothetical protein